MKSRCLGRCVKQLHHNLRYWLKNKIVDHYSLPKMGLFQFILELCTSSPPLGIKSPHLESRLDPGHTVRPYQSWNQSIYFIQDGRLIQWGNSVLSKNFCSSPLVGPDRCALSSGLCHWWIVGGRAEIPSLSYAMWHSPFFYMHIHPSSIDPWAWSPSQLPSGGGRRHVTMSSQG